MEADCPVPLLWPCLYRAAFLLGCARTVGGARSEAAQWLSPSGSQSECELGLEPAAELDSHAADRAPQATVIAAIAGRGAVTDARGESGVSRQPES